MNTLKKQAGVTLHELIIALSVIALLMSLSAPSYSEFINKRKIAGAADMIGMYFENVKMESVKRNVWVTVNYKETSDGTAWCLGAQIGKHKRCDCMAAPAEEDYCQFNPDDANDAAMILSNTSYADFNDLLTAASVSADYHMDFNPVRGTLSHAEKVSIQVKHASEDFLVNISVTPTGRVTKCTPSTHKLVGYATCI